ncbi:uncharacterized protein FIBRA_00232 [Fibroporia radiculosa]|uniref:PH domain-containing protein n=1 Tax=Fibroporia radiculosa TaxID=599839 RepID=J7SCM4_9APHY|nr:uncharacterized protein FIBRA_00232 [Fibroporia radiculosa]CCL98238.1 predicted protein [Fibroporia radiculosa]
MPIFSDGDDSVDAPTLLYSTDDMRTHLQGLLDGKEKQLQQAGTLGQQLLAQRMELEERIRQLQEVELDGDSDDENADTSVREKYRELGDIIKTWDEENEQLTTAFGSKVNDTRVQVNSLDDCLRRKQQLAHSADLSRELDRPDRSADRSKAAAAGPSAAQSSRRAKNAAHRADDVEFAFEIGSGLLTEVRRLQSLLGERDKAIQDMKEEKDDLDKTVESLRTALRQQEQSADKFKEENWNLEVTLQELRAQFTDSQASVQRLEGEQKRVTKMLAAAREAVDQHKNEAERHHNSFQELKAKHETDIAQARKHAASLQRDKSDLQQSLDSMKAEMSKANKRFPRFGSPLTPNGAASSDALTPGNQDEEDVFGTTGRPSTNNRKNIDNTAFFSVEAFDEFADSSPDPSPSRPFLAPNHPSNEIEALQQRLAHAQRQINTLKGTLQREKELRMEYRRKLDSSPGYAIEEEADEFVDEDAEEPKSKPHLTPYRVGRGRGRGRSRGGLTLTQRLGMAAYSPSSEYNDDDPHETSPPPPVPSLPAAFKVDGHVADEEIQEDELDVQASPSPQGLSNRTSVDGMDPAFANILRRSSSASSFQYNGSPLRQSAIARASRGGTFPRRSRGGAAYQEARPPSLVGQPEALAAELGLGFGIASTDNSIAHEFTEETVRPIETAEFACQTEFEEVQYPLPIHVIPDTSEMGIQVEPSPVPLVTKLDIQVQTEVEPLPSRLDTAVQHEDMTPVKILVSSSVNTELIPEPVLPSKPVLVQAEVQTAGVHSVEIDVQTIPEPEPEPVAKTDVIIQTLPPVTVEMETQTSEVTVNDMAIQASQVEIPHFMGPVDMSVRESSFGDSSGDITIHANHARPASLNLSEAETEDEFDMETETGSMMETDTDDYQDARQSITMPTPTDSINDFHSIMTVTDNDFSESEDDNESIVASRLPSRQGLPTMSAVSLDLPSPSVSIPALPGPTYEDVGTLTDFIEESESHGIVADIPIIEPESAPEPKPELKEISIQTDEWVPPPAFAPVTAPPTPAPGPVPNLYRVGVNSQQFQFISPPSSAGPTTTSMPIVAAPSPIAIIRDSNATFTARPRTSHSDRRQSIESTLSSGLDDFATRSRTPSTVPGVVDKSRPPNMALPPPPRAPPPPNSMLPPPFIPEKRLSHDIPPPRPSSPPPPELIQRATTPTFGSALSVPGGRNFGLRQHGSSMPPSQQGLRELPSTSSFRSAANAAARAPLSSPTPSSMSFGIKERERRELSTTSLNSGGRSLGSQRSSISSDHHGFQPQRLADAVNITDRSADVSSRSVGSTDPTIIHAITQTMIGEFLFKYTRRTIGKGHGSTRHKRFVWIHPYTRTLYWSSADPGSSNVIESSAKSAYVEGVRSVLDPNPMPPGIYQYSVVVSTPQREMKFTAPTKERHDIWINALKYLLTRPGAVPTTSPGGPPVAPLSPMSINRDLPDEENNGQHLIASPQSQRSARTTRTALSVESWNVTPRGQRSHSQISLGGSVGKRSGTPAAEYLRWMEHDNLHSPTKEYEHIPAHDEGDLDFELHDDTMSDGGFEGLENVRACCDGRHTVGRSGKHHHHHHEHHHEHVQKEPPRIRDQHLQAAVPEVARPASPAWSFRSRAGSATSHEGAGFFSRFGTRRSTKTVPGISAGGHDQS